MPKPKRIKFDGIIDGAEFSHGRATTIPIVIDPDDAAGGPNIRTGVSVRLFFKCDGIPFMQNLATYDFVGNAADTRQVVLTPLRGHSHAIQVIAWNRRGMGLPAPIVEIRTKKLRISVRGNDRGSRRST